MFAVIDRIEETAAGNRLAVLACDDDQHLVVPLADLPVGSREGAVLAVRWTIDAVETQRRRDRVRALQHELFGGE